MMNSDASVGAVVSLWRYPVKSMQGEELNASVVNERGLLGDRSFALIDIATGMTVSAKNPRKWGKMFDCRAALADTGANGSLAAVKITLPDGSFMTGDAAEINQILSELFQREVKLETSAPAKPSLEEYWPTVEGLPHQDAVTDEATLANTFFDGATVHVLTTATLDQLQAIAPSSRFETRRFRPNIVVKAEGDGFVENDWVGQTLAIGDQVRLQVSGPCPRCVMTTMPQAELPDDVNILRTAVQQNQGNVGIYASVAAGGTVRRGDTVRVIA
jgi:uncharacterized protein